MDSSSNKAFRYQLKPVTDGFSYFLKQPAFSSVIFNLTSPGVTGEEHCLELLLTVH